MFDNMKKVGQKTAIVIFSSSVFSEEYDGSPYLPLSTHTLFLSRWLMSFSCRYHAL